MKEYKIKSNCFVFLLVFAGFFFVLLTPLHSKGFASPYDSFSALVCGQDDRSVQAVVEDEEEDEEIVYIGPQACGVERWAVKTGTDVDAGLVDLGSVTVMTVADLGALTRPDPIPSSTRYQPTEITVFQVFTTLTLYKLESDSDYHLVLDDGQGHTMITEIPSPACVGSSSPFAALIANARAQFDAVYTATTSFKTANVPVRITGVGFFDFPHGQTGYAPNGIELHPVLDIIFNPSSLPPEVSPAGAAVPFKITRSGNGLNFRFQYLGTTNLYDIYGAPDQVSMDAGNWTFKICDLQHNSLGTWTTDGSTYISWTLTNGSSLPDSKYVVIQEASGTEGPYGFKSNGTPIHPDTDRSTPASLGCTTGCTAVSSHILSVMPDTTVNQGTPQTFSGSGTGQGTLTYAWDFHFNGTTFNTEATGQTPTYTYASTGAYEAALKVTDSCPSPGPQSALSTVAININPAGSCGPIVVISQVYGGGGNSGAYYKNDFIELFNRGDQLQDLTDWSVQYASAAGSTWSVTPLNGSIPAGGYYLIQEAQGAGGTANLPTPDATGTIAMSATAAKVALVNTATALTGTCPTGTSIVDFIGYGTTANCFEGSAAAPALTNTTSDRRAAAGCTDTNNNSSDFTALTCDSSNPPRNSATTHNNCTCP